MATRPRVPSSARGGAPVRPVDVKEAALRLFAERGYYGTSMKDIAEALGIRAPSLYNHVHSKQVILNEIVFDALADLEAATEAALRATAGKPHAVRLRALTVAHVRHHATFRRETRIAEADLSSLDPVPRDEFRARRKAYADKWQSLIESGNDAGEFDVRSPRISTWAILEMGIAVAGWFSERGSLSIDDLADEYGRIALRIVGAAES